MATSSREPELKKCLFVMNREKTKITIGPLKTALRYAALNEGGQYFIATPTREKDLWNFNKREVAHKLPELPPELMRENDNRIEEIKKRVKKKTPMSDAMKSYLNDYVVKFMAEKGIYVRLDVVNETKSGLVFDEKWRDPIYTEELIKLYAQGEGAIVDIYGKELASSKKPPKPKEESKEELKEEIKEEAKEELKEELKEEAKEELKEEAKKEPWCYVIAENPETHQPELRVFKATNHGVLSLGAPVFASGDLEVSVEKIKEGKEEEKRESLRAHIYEISDGSGGYNSNTSTVLRYENGSVIKSRSPDNEDESKGYPTEEELNEIQQRFRNILKVVGFPLDILVSYSDGHYKGGAYYPARKEILSVSDSQEEIRRKSKEEASSSPPSPAEVKTPVVGVGAEKKTHHIGTYSMLFDSTGRLVPGTVEKLPAKDAKDSHVLNPRKGGSK